MALTQLSKKFDGVVRPIAFVDVLLAAFHHPHRVVQMNDRVSPWARSADNLVLCTANSWKISVLESDGTETIEFVKILSV